MQDQWDSAEHQDSIVEPNRGQNMPPVPAVPVVTSTDSMTRDTVLASCPRRAWRPDATLLSFDEEKTAHGTEVFRALRARLFQLQKNSPLKSLLITSAVGKEGRSFVAANLAQAMALQPECRVLLIDADLRTPTLHSILGTSSSPGFAEYLLQEVEEFGIMQRGAAENLFFIPSGRAVNRPTELIANNRLKSLIDQVEPLFDWIIVDSPAATPVSDAGLLANYFDGVLMVVRSNSTPFDAVRKARERFREESLVGVVLNEMPAEPKPRRHFWGSTPNSDIRG
jgi:capsular exopolysaccharide synthesis family protein